MRCLFLALLAPIIHGQAWCEGEVLDAYNKCVQSVPHVITVYPYYGLDTISSDAGRLAICYGDYPACNDVQRIAKTSAGYCAVRETRGLSVLSDKFPPCPNPLPPRLVEKKLCTATGLILSEYYGKLYTDIVRNNLNEQFIVNQTARMIIAKSNGQCLEASRGSDGKYTGLNTAPCNFQNVYQLWDVKNNRITRPDVDLCMATEPFQRGSLVTGAPCPSNPLSMSFFTDCEPSKPVNFYIQSTRTSKRIIEYYSELYHDITAVDGPNKLFSWDSNTKMIKSLSSQQCLDAYLDKDNKYKIHTYTCDIKNANQKWIVHSDTKKIEHGTHKGQCIDGDPTYADHHLQMWACLPENRNQEWEFIVAN